MSNLESAGDRAGLSTNTPDRLMGTTTVSNQSNLATGDQRVELAAEHLQKMPLPTGNYDADLMAIAAALTDDMVPPTPDGCEFVQWEIDPPDTVLALFAKAEAR